MRDNETILTEIRILEGKIHLEKVNHPYNMDWNKYNKLVLELKELKEELK